MAMQTIKNGGFVAEEIGKINSNFALCAEKTELPTKTSDLTNDSNFVTSANVPTKTSQLTNDSGFITNAAIPTVPTKTSDLTNDSGFITSASVPTKTSDLTNDSNFVTTSTMNTGLNGKVDKINGKGLSTNDYTTDEKNKLAGLSAPTKVTFTASNWSNGTYTTAANGKTPSVVMRKNGSNYGVALVDVQTVGTNVVITSDEAFEGYMILV